MGEGSRGMRVTVRGQNRYFCISFKLNLKFNFIFDLLIIPRGAAFVKNFGTASCHSAKTIVLYTYNEKGRYGNEQTTDGLG